eukprot:CAMPEP_0117071840 /NCGR_PEP_ID=MMETSP0472-20121206/50523_1 /TAXON_ID=693140 ORGANISM="Tiarina fusus, Strain LIS" /NCGR_SAMPLE_ID=MMETSP0472 /ASSEMBLY_ACC=CAM_ASM_000603 /LENGTH=47 /DNA_ID= /DNA_START= /DNA_END= /DNA_ORIENTATION=
MMATEDVETQQKGSIFICYALNSKQMRRGSQGSNWYRNLANITGSLP